MTGFQLFDALPVHIEDALRASIERFGVLVPVAVTQDGEVLDGHHRKRIAQDLGVEFDVTVIDVADEDEAREIAVTLNADRRQLDPERRREVVAHLRQNGHSYRAIGEALGVSHPTVMKDAAESGGNDLPPQPETVRGTDGKQYPATRRVTERESHSTTVEETAAADEPSRLAPMMSSDSPEWYTPSDIVSRVVKVLDGIDLDPCSNSHDNPNVPAGAHYTQADDGLSQPWHGTVYMNPPYGRGIDQWVQKLRDEFYMGNVVAAVALVPARTDTRWFRILRDFPVCFLDGRLRFHNGDDSGDAAPFPSCAFYLGDQDVLFNEVFAPVGDVYLRWEMTA